MFADLENIGHVDVDEHAIPDSDDDDENEEENEQGDDEEGNKDATAPPGESYLPKTHQYCACGHFIMLLWVVTEFL